MVHQCTLCSYTYVQMCIHMILKVLCCNIGVIIWSKHHTLKIYMPVKGVNVDFSILQKCLDFLGTIAQQCCTQTIQSHYINGNETVITFKIISNYQTFLQSERCLCWCTRGRPLYNFHFLYYHHQYTYKPSSSPIQNEQCVDLHHFILLHQMIRVHNSQVMPVHTCSQGVQEVQLNHLNFISGEPSQICLRLIIREICYNGDKQVKAVRVESTCK